MVLSKHELRLNMKNQRKALSVSDVQQKSRLIQQRLFSLPEFISAQTVLFYVSYDNEVFTHEMIQEALNMGKTVVVPKSDTTTNTIDLYRITHWNELTQGAYGILEPKQVLNRVAVHDLDCIIVPGVVFDKQGNRVGHGKGYYDRLLASSKTIPTVGLAYEFQIVKRIDAEIHDEKVNMIVTEQQIIRCTA